MSPVTSATDSGWNEFLMSVERRALHMATIATGCRETALDIVQDAMLGLVSKYRNRPVEELPPLFYCILQSRIRDCYRRQKVRRRWQLWRSPEQDKQDPDRDPIENAPASESCDPARLLAGSDAMEALNAALRKLPHRQQQTFLLRAWEGLSVAETAVAMSCSQGSVKTHYSRALHTLRERLEDHWP
jgi:RNA polymerase sigma-70 factor (ECF subfamily)